MSLDFKNRDSTAELIGYVKTRAESCFCIAPVDVWIGSYWRSYLNLGRQGDVKENFGPLLYGFFQGFSVEFDILKKAYQKIDRNDLFNLSANKPYVYIDLEGKYLASYFQEQSLEDKLPEDWIGEYREIGDLIPKEFRYWE